MSELDLIQFIKQKSFEHPLVSQGIGDDCAVIESHPLKSLVTTDTLMDGVHFLCDEASPEDIANKCLGVNLSDIAAMGGVPEFCTLSLCIPKIIEQEFLERFIQKFTELCSHYQVSLAGGDTNSWSGPLVVSVTLWGRPHPKGPIGRDGARPGDLIYVSGPLGGSLAGHHLTFTPRLEFARQLLDVCTPSAMIDLSDGLGTDLQHILNRSQVGATLDQQALLPRDNLSQQSPQQQLKAMLSDGEDFELCFTLSPDQAAQVESHFGIKAIGVIQDKAGLYWKQSGEKIELKGYQHRFNVGSVTHD